MVGFRFGLAALLFGGAIFVSIDNAFSHGFAGSRFFPATLSIDDPFVADELSLPTVSSTVTPDEGGTRETELSVDIAKRIGAEAVIPVNSRTGSDVGFIAQLHFYLDDLFPHTIGRPLFGRKQ